MDHSPDDPISAGLLLTATGRRRRWAGSRDSKEWCDPWNEHKEAADANWDLHMIERTKDTIKF
jgi:hypothetical protein